MFVTAMGCGSCGWVLVWDVCVLWMCLGVSEKGSFEGVRLGWVWYDLGMEFGRVFS